MSALRIAAALILDQAGRTLLVRKCGTSFFMQPGGKIEPSETPLAALVREVREELGLAIDRNAAVYLGKFIAEAANEHGLMLEADCFTADIATAVAPAGEIAEIAWVDPFDMPELALAPLTRDHMLPLARQLRKTS